MVQIYLKEMVIENVFFFSRAFLCGKVLWSTVMRCAFIYPVWFPQKEVWGLSQVACLCVIFISILKFFKKEKFRIIFHELSHFADFWIAIGSPLGLVRRGTRVLVETSSWTFFVVPIRIETRFIIPFDDIAHHFTLVIMFLSIYNPIIHFKVVLAIDIVC